jgi:hypothetical protein
MSTNNQPPVYDELVEFLASSAKPEQVLAFQLSDEKQNRLDDLLSKNRDQTLSPQESAELDAFEQFERVVRLLKARVRENRINDTPNG